MTREIFREWLLWFGRHVGTVRQILLILYNLSGHIPKHITPPNIKIGFLPPNTTSKVPPCDLGIIHTLKAHTRRAILRSLLDFTEEYPTLESRHYSIPGGETKVLKFAPDILKAMTIMTSAWHMVTATTITNCFRKAGIRHDDHGLFAWHDPLAEVTDILDVIKVDMRRMRPEQYHTIGNDVKYFVNPIQELIEEKQFESEVTLAQLIKPYQQLANSVGEEDDSEVARKIWGNEAREALTVLKLYVQQQWDPGMISLVCENVQDNTAVAVQRDLNSLERYITAIQLRNAHHQTSIKSFLSPLNDSDLAIAALESSAALEGSAVLENSAAALENLPELEELGDVGL